MNKKLIGLGMLLAANGAFAQTASPTSIEIYGVIDIGVGHSSNSLSEDPNFSVNMNPVANKYGNAGVTGMFNGGEAPSRIGFKGSEDLGGGLRAVFTLETGFNSPDGVISNSVGSLVNNKSTAPANGSGTVSGDSSLAGQLFNRQANVGLSSADMGTLTAGRNYSFGFENLVAFDPMDGSQTFSPLGYSGSFAGGGFTEDFRIDNSLKYKFQTNGINVGALYKFGGQAGSTNAQGEYQLTLGYENGPFAVQGTYSMVHDGISAGSSATGGNVNITVADTTAYMLAASYKMNQWRLRGGYERVDFDSPSNPTLDAGITSALGYSVGTVNLAAYDVAGVVGQKKLTTYFAGLTYDVTPAFDATVAVYDQQQNNYSAAPAGCASGATCSGTSKYLSVLGDYKLSKRTHVYAGYMYNKVAGGLAAGFINNSNTFFGAGVKHSF